MNLMFVGNGVLGEIYVPRHRIADGVWRAAQPAPRHFEKFAAEGIRTILNLRGGRTSCGAYALEAETCSRLGLRLVNFPLRSRSSLDRDTVLTAIDIWARLERSEEHTSELQSLMRISYAVFCLKTTQYDNKKDQK